MDLREGGSSDHAASHTDRLRLICLRTSQPGTSRKPPSSRSHWASEDGRLPGAWMLRNWYPFGPGLHPSQAHTHAHTHTHTNTHARTCKHTRVLSTRPVECSKWGAALPWRRGLAWATLTRLTKSVGVMQSVPLQARVCHDHAQRAAPFRWLTCPHANEDPPLTDTKKMKKEKRGWHFRKKREKKEEV